MPSATLATTPDTRRRRSASIVFMLFVFCDICLLSVSCCYWEEPKILRSSCPETGNGPATAFRSLNVSFEEFRSAARVSLHSRDQSPAASVERFLSENVRSPCFRKLSSPASQTPSSNESSSGSNTAMIAESLNSSLLSESKVAGSKSCDDVEASSNGVPLFSVLKVTGGWRTFSPLILYN